MSDFSHLLIWNVTLATGLAIVIALAGFLPALQRRPALRHWLWMLVLVKLATPPLIPLPILSSTDEASEAPPVDAAEVGVIAEAMPLPTPIDAVLAVPAPVDLMPTENAVDAPVATAAQVPAAVAGSSRVDWLLALLTVSLLITGLLVTRSIGQMIRLFRLFVRCRHQDRRASDIAAREAAKMQVHREPTVALVSARMTPLLWVRRGHPKIVLSAALVEQLDDDQLACVIRHELAHFVRRDHCATAIAFVVASLFWWNPVAWWARREMRRAQEACCDSLAVASAPQSRRCYAETLLHVIDFLGGQSDPLPPLAAAFGEARSLKRRFAMLANEKVTHRLSRVAKVLLICGAMAIGCYPVLSQTGTDARSFRLTWQPEGSRYRLLELPASDNGKWPKSDIIVTCARMQYENDAIVLIDAVVESENELFTAAELTVPFVDVTNASVGELALEAARRARQTAEGESRIVDEWKVDSRPAYSGLGIRSFRISAQDPATVVKIAAALELLGANCDVNVKPGYDPETIVIVDKMAERKIAGLLAEIGLAMSEDDRTVVRAAPKPDVIEDDIIDDLYSASYRAFEVRAALGTWADHPPTQKKLRSAIELLGGACEITHDFNAMLNEVKVVAKQSAAGKVRDYLRTIGFPVDQRQTDQAASEPKARPTLKGQVDVPEGPSRNATEPDAPNGDPRDTGTTGAAKQSNAEKTQRIYSLQFAAAQQVHDVLSALKQPDTVVEVHPRTNQIVVQATEPQHRELAEVIGQLDAQEPPKSLAVIELTKSNPKAIQVLLQKMFEGTTEDAPKFDIDLDRRRLIVRGTAAQARQVRNLIVGLDQLITGPGDQDDAASGAAASTIPQAASPAEDDPFALPAAAPPATGLPESAKVTTDGEGNVVGVKLTGESNLNRFTVTPEIIDALTKLKSLRTLSLWGTTVGDREIERLAALKHLQLIDLSFTDITGESLRALSSLKELVSLRLEGCDVKDKHLIALGDMPQLAMLYLGCTQITDAGLKHIRRLEKLNLLQLSDCQITDQGLASLGRIPRIQHLWLSKTIRNGEDDRSDLTDGCVDYLISLDTLVDLQIADSQLTESGLQRLREGLPKAKVSTQRTGITYGRRAED